MYQIYEAPACRIAKDKRERERKRKRKREGRGGRCPDVLHEGSDRIGDKTTLISR